MTRRLTPMDSRVVEVIVRGRLGPDIVAALPEFRIDTDADGLTWIVGAIPDQAKLLGILEMFDALHIDVVSVNPVETI